MSDEHTCDQCRIQRGLVAMLEAQKDRLHAELTGARREIMAARKEIENLVGVNLDQASKLKAATSASSQSAFPATAGLAEERARAEIEALFTLRKMADHGANDQVQYDAAVAILGHARGLSDAK